MNDKELKNFNESKGINFCLPCYSEAYADEKHTCGKGCQHLNTMETGAGTLCLDYYEIDRAFNAGGDY